MSTAGVAGAAFDAAVSAVNDAAAASELRRLQLRFVAAREAFDAAERKVAKCEAHLAGARQSLAVAEADAREAAAALSAHGGQ